MTSHCKDWLFETSKIKHAGLKRTPFPMNGVPACLFATPRLLFALRLFSLRWLKRKLVKPNRSDRESLFFASRLGAIGILQLGSFLSCVLPLEDNTSGILCVSPSAL